jgi:arylsulfatase
VDDDFSQSNDLAAENPDKLKELQTLFLEEAEKFQVLPLDDRLFERFIASMVGRPDLMEGRTSMTLHEGMTGMMDNVFINVKNRSHTITAELVIPDGETDGVVVCQGGRFGGWSLYTKGGVLNYAYNWVGLEQYKLADDKPLPAGKVTVKFDFTYDGGGLGKGGKGTLFVNGEKVAEERIDHTASVIFSPDETADVGVDEATNVTDDYPERDNRFTGRISKVTVEVK